MTPPLARVVSPPPSPVHHPGSQIRPDSPHVESLGSRKGPCQPQPSSPVLHWLWLRPRAPPPPPSCPMEQPGCSKGARRAWLGSQRLGWGPGHPGKVAPPCLAPSSLTLHLVSPLDQTRNKENVWNLSCLLFLLPVGRGLTAPLGKMWPRRIGYCLSPGRRPVLGG